MRKIDPNSIIPMCAFNEVNSRTLYSEPGRNAGNLVNNFPGLYHPEATIVWAHKEIAAIVLTAGKICKKVFGWTLFVVDGLRTVEAQKQMQDHHYPPLLVSTPGTGGHPRAMAIDILAVHGSSVGGKFVNMGVPFDFFSPNPEIFNPSSRVHTAFASNFEQAALFYLNRQKLEFSMRAAADLLESKILPLEEEWWDFRLPRERYQQFMPLRERDLLPSQRLLDPDVDALKEIKAGIYPKKMQKTIEHTRKVLNKVEETSLFKPPCFSVDF
ncbi:MAG: hypothetical protein AAGA53_01345 [Pseudomonadota bacterium]